MTGFGLYCTGMMLSHCYTNRWAQITKNTLFCLVLQWISPNMCPLDFVSYGFTSLICPYSSGTYCTFQMLWTTRNSKQACFYRSDPQKKPFLGLGSKKQTFWFLREQIDNTSDWEHFSSYWQRGLIPGSNERSLLGHKSKWRVTMLNLIELFSSILQTTINITSLQVELKRWMQHAQWSFTGFRTLYTIRKNPSSIKLHAMTHQSMNTAVSSEEAQYIVMISSSTVKQGNQMFILNEQCRSFHT